MDLSFTPTLDPQLTLSRLERLLVPGPLRAPELGLRIERLAAEFRRWAAVYPLPLWALGLIVTPEMRSLSEVLFPIARVRSAFLHLFREGCRFPADLSGSYLYSCASWPDLLHRLQPALPQADPSPLLHRLTLDSRERTRLLFTLLLPQHFGGSFDRYPAQAHWLLGWLRENFRRLGGRVRALDSACGSGEGTYGLAEILLCAGFGAGSAVHGSTLEPIELFAAAHAFFPHDSPRQREYRLRVAPLLAPRAPLELQFYLDEVGRAFRGESYQVILCNGLLGGPLLHQPDRLAAALAALAGRLAPDGIFLAADRFHQGWRLRVPREELVGLMQRAGLTPLPVPEGVAGVKRRGSGSNAKRPSRNPARPLDDSTT